MIDRIKFALQIQQSNAILYTLAKGHVTNSCIVKRGSPLPDILRQHPNAPLHLVIDTPMMSLDTIPLPTMSPWGLWQSLQQKKQKFSEGHALWGARLCRKQKQWYISTVAFPAEIDDWLEWAQSGPNPIASLRSLAHENSSIIQELRNRSGWQLLLGLHEENKVRMSLFQDDHLLWTRETSIEMTESPEDLAMSLTSILKETVMFLAREHSGLEEKLDVFAIVDDETRRHFKPRFLPRHQLHILTPYQLAVRVGLTGRVPFRYIDTLLIKSTLAKWRSCFPLSSHKVSLNLSPHMRKGLMGACALIGVFVVERGIMVFLESQRLGHIEEMRNNLIQAQQQLIQKRGV